MSKLFIIHGWTYKLEKWADICKVLQQQGIEPVLLKVPGLTEPSQKVWDIDGYVSWLDDQLKNESKPTVVGHSNGGRIALSYLQRYPGKFSRLILIDSAGIPHDQQAKARAKLKILRVISKFGKLFSFIPPVKNLFYKVIGAQDYLNAPPNMKTTMQNMLNADSAIDLHKITVPTTIIWGRDDTITPLSDGEKLHAGITGSQLHVIDGGRHAPMATHAQQVADLIVAVMKGKAS